MAEADQHVQCGRSVAAAYQSGLADARRQIAEWADDQMQALPERRTPVAHGKAEVLTELRQRIAVSAAWSRTMTAADARTDHTDSEGES